MAFGIDSTAFRHQGEIPARHARKGENLAPPLAWHDAPPETRSFALVVEDPDAPSGTFRHWAVYDLTADTTALPEGAPGDIVTTSSGVNDFGNKGYDGPQPPAGHGPHHYRFRLAALDVDRLDLPDDATAAQVWTAAQRHAIAEAEIVGTFENR